MGANQLKPALIPHQRIQIDVSPSVEFPKSPINANLIEKHWCISPDSAEAAEGAGRFAETRHPSAVTEPD